MSKADASLRSAIGLSVGAALFSVLVLLGYGIARGERATAREFADAHRVEATVTTVEPDARGSRVRYAIDGREYEVLLDDRGTGAHAVGDRLAIEVARHDPRRAVLRVGTEDYVLPGVLIVGGLVPTLVCAWLGWSTRRRLPLLPRRVRGTLARVAMATPELAFAALFGGIWLLPDAFPRGLVEGLEWSLLLEAMLEITACLAVPVLLEPGRSSRVPRIVAGLVVLGLLLKVTAGFAAVAGVWAWWMLAALLASRGVLLFLDRHEERVHQLDRWAHGLVLLLLACWIANALGWLVPLPPAGILRAPPADWDLPGSTALAWGLVYYLLQALARAREWPRRRAGSTPPTARGAVVRAAGAGA